MYPIDKSSNKPVKSICKIEIEKNNKKEFGTGFLLKIPRKNKDIFYCLMTNEHVIDQSMIDGSELITIFFDNQKQNRKIKLDKKSRFIQSYRYMEIDATVVEIIKDDKISKDSFLSFNFELNFEYKNNPEKLIGKKIYILQFPYGEDLKYSEGDINEINIYINQLSHSSSTEYGSSGSPIFLCHNNELIGIHKQKSRNGKKNFGNFIFPVVLSIRNNYQYNEKKYKDGIYEGDYNNDVREGYGHFFYNNGDVYFGQWLNNKRHYKGILYYYKYKTKNKTKYKIKYIGDFINDEYDGIGQFFF